MRRMLIALVLVCGVCLPLATFSAARADDTATGPVALTVHAAVCPIDLVNDPDVGLFDACHANGIEGVTFTFSSLETVPVSLTTGADGVGSVDILDGMSSATQVTLSADDASAGYTYCADEHSGAVLFDGHRIADNPVPLFTVDASQSIVCDWYIYTDETAAG